MDYEQVKLIDQTVRTVHHALANLLVTTSVTLERQQGLAPETQAVFLKQWETLHLHAIQALQGSLASLRTLNS